MSCPQEPTASDTEFQCTGRGTGRHGLCIYRFWIPKDKTTGHETLCETCETVNGVIAALSTLVFREPWWSSEGKAGEPAKEAWELDGPEEKKADREGDEGEAAFGDGMTTEERIEFRRKMEESFAATQGSSIVGGSAAASASPAGTTELGSGSWLSAKQSIQGSTPYGEGGLSGKESV